ncbi:gamma-glutamyl-gamma-aminobutyrate hydrolase family protein [Roseiflexus sp.]|uniref:gamma-glutamyl-gamma-aminobutyrate hydrolase family protein n=1 Tax=Roseiflexus sp. TaxID=2562120 RepID=UPI0021DD9BFA|nr:gamma-glutamyl-gamma-aminobutyrate hydrolase family protein [Roseiflexus sp.]GIW02153.1 MAG: gamma-glutamyl-gamma-aminobutyrate hydrolase [Roseiflexus sp.]
MNRVCIGITCGTFYDHDWCPPSIGHRKTYIDAVVAAGGAPFLIPSIDDEAALRMLYDRIDGVLLAGGGDIEPRHYGEAPLPTLGVVDALRDRTELPLVRWAVADGKPVLGICRGAQMVNVALGGTLYQDIPSQIETSLNHSDSYARQDWTHLAHMLRLSPDSRLRQILGSDELPINSLHHQSIKTVAPGLMAVGWAPDGVIEAIESANGHFLIGVQCHPEALQSRADPRWQTLFRRFVEACARFKDRNAE